MRKTVNPFPVRRDAWTKANATAKRLLLQRLGERACAPVMQSACALPVSCLLGLRRTVGSAGGQDCARKLFVPAPFPVRRDAWTKANARAKRRLLQRRGERACVPVMQSACAPPASCLSGLRRTAGSSGGQDCPASRLWQPLFPFGEGDTWTKANARAKRRLLQRSGEWVCAPVMQSACAPPASYLSGLHRTAGSASGQDCAHKPPVVAPFPVGRGGSMDKSQRNG